MSDIIQDRKVFCVDCAYFNACKKNRARMQIDDTNIHEICSAPQNIRPSYLSDGSDKFISAPSIINKYNNCTWFIGKSTPSDIAHIIDVHNRDPEAHQVIIEPLKQEVAERMQQVDYKLDQHKEDQSNPHHVTKDQVGLDKVDNTSDLEKPVSRATQVVIDGETTRAMAAEKVLSDKVDLSEKFVKEEVAKIQHGFHHMDHRVSMLSDSLHAETLRATARENSLGERIEETKGVIEAKISGIERNCKNYTDLRANETLTAAEDTARVLSAQAVGTANEYTDRTAEVLRQEIKEKVKRVWKYQGSVDYRSDLDRILVKEYGDVYNVRYDEHGHPWGHNFVWTEQDGWDDIGGLICLDNYYTKGEVDSKFTLIEEKVDQKFTEFDNIITEKLNNLQKDLNQFKETVKEKIGNIPEDQPVSEFVIEKANEAAKNAADYTDGRIGDIGDVTVKDYIDSKHSSSYTKEETDNIINTTKAELTEAYKSDDTALKEELQTEFNKKISDGDNSVLNQSKSYTDQARDDLDKADKQLKVDINNVQIDLNAKIERSHDTLQSAIDSVNGNLTARIQETHAALQNSIDGVNANLTDKIQTAHQLLQSNIDAVNSNLTSKIDIVSSEVGNLGIKVDDHIEKSSTEIAKKANIEDVYDKATVDSKIAAFDDEIAKKANSEDVYDKPTIDGKFDEVDIKINEAATAAETYIDQEVGKVKKDLEDNYAKKADTLAGYGITDALTDEETNTLVSNAVGHLDEEITKEGGYKDQAISASDSHTDAKIGTIDTDTVKEYVDNNSTADQAYTRSYVDQKISSIAQYKGSVDKFEDLPTDTAQPGWIYHVNEDGKNYIRNEAGSATDWSEYTATIVLDNYYNKAETDKIVGDAVNALDTKINEKVDQETYDTEMANKASHQYVDDADTNLDNKISALEEKEDQAISDLDTKVDGVETSILKKRRYEIKTIEAVSTDPVRFNLFDYTSNNIDLTDVAANTTVTLVVPEKIADYGRELMISITNKASGVKFVLISATDGETLTIDDGNLLSTINKEKFIIQVKEYASSKLAIDEIGKGDTINNDKINIDASQMTITSGGIKYYFLVENGQLVLREVND